jgi:hypothetical protein
MFSHNLMENFLIAPEENSHITHIVGGNPIGGQMSINLDKHYSTPFPFSSLAATNSLQGLN